MYNEIILTNNNLFIIGRIELNVRAWEIQSIRFFQNHVGNEYYTN